jgi:hypothetical protein
MWYIYRLLLKAFEAGAFASCCARAHVHCLFGVHGKFRHAAHDQGRQSFINAIRIKMLMYAYYTALPGDLCGCADHEASLKLAR